MKLGGLATILKKVERPCFTLQIRAAGCRYDVRLNDIPVDRHDAPSRMALDVPVNPSVFTGNNELAAVVFPGDRDAGAFDPAARLELLLCVREMDTPPAERRVLGGIVFEAAGLKPEGGTGVEASADLEGPPARAEVVADDMILVERTISLETPFPAWTWMNATVLPDTSGVRARVLSELESFHTAIAQADDRALRTMLRRKARETARAFHTDEEEGYALLDVFRHMADRDMTLLPFEDRGLETEFLAGGRMVRLVTPSGLGPVAFRVNDQPAAAWLHTIYCFDDRARWVQIR